MNDQKVNKAEKDTITPQELIQRLSAAGYPPVKVESMMEGRISYRALYRWRNGEAQPQRKSDFSAVLRLAKALGINTDLIAPRITPTTPINSTP